MSTLGWQPQSIHVVQTEPEGSKRIRQHVKQNSPQQQMISEGTTAATMHSTCVLLPPV